MLAAADLIAGAIASGILVGAFARPDSALPWAAGFIPVWVMAAKLHGLYDRDHRAMRHLTIDEVPSIAAWAATGTVALALLLSAAVPGEATVGRCVIAWIAASASAFALRAAMRALWRRITPPERVVILGDAGAVEATRRKIALFPDMHMQPVESNGTPADPDAVVADADRLVLASGRADADRVGELVAVCRRRAVKLTVASPIRPPQTLAMVADLPILEYNTWDVSRSTVLLKRVADVAISAAALVVLAPLLTVIAVAIRLDSRGRVIFSQSRAGLDGRPFRIYKFRTMTADAEQRLGELVRVDELAEPMFKLRSDPRITRVGRVLRRTSLDELPQLFNVLRGDMSLVGPRPEQLDLVRRYRPEHRFRLAVKPGLTGPMQVYGRGDLTFEERLAVERDYVENLSMTRDARILAITIAAVTRGNGAY
jgi:exopolysaccharide biosynthesis polyprenyl glycosylphosphotransferase